MTWVAAAVASAGLTAGGIQYFKGKADQKRNKRPTYEIPDEVKQNMSLQQQMALQGIPEAQKQAFIDNIQRSSATSLRNLGSRNAGLAGVAQVQQQQNNAYQNLFAMDAQARQANQKGLLDQNQNLANYRDQAFQFNQVNPYYEKTAKNEALMGAGLQNISKGFQLGASTMGKYPGQGGPRKPKNMYDGSFNGYQNSNPNFSNYMYGQGSVQEDLYNGMYDNNNQDLYNDFG